MTEEPMRPDPDRLLIQTQGRTRGKLKIFFGACAGVGKTYAMLQEAQRLRAQGLDILVGVVETHGRQETAALLEGLAIQPLKRIHHRGRVVQEFDLDAALARNPALILMDELAHSNAPGSRHPKRWQDVDELLDAGIDVFTTVNVQHLESLNDVVGGVTGIQVRETVPDPIFDAADEIVLVDLPPDDLRQRLHEGKVYIAGQAERAIEHFFRKGNLIALRELALRRTADRVDDQMRAWRDRQGQEKVWHTRDAILLCIGQGAGNEKLVRTAARLGAGLGSVWHAVYVETPRLHRLPETSRRAILSALLLAQELGAETATLADPVEEKAVLRYAREHNLGKIVIGRRNKRRWWSQDTFAERLARHAPDLDLLIVALDDKPTPATAKAADNRPFMEKWRVQLRGCAVAVALCALITLVAHQWLIAFDAANLVMVYLLGVVLVALFYGRWPSVVATIINVVSFDLFFIAPRGTLAVSDVQYLLTFAVMLSVGLVIVEPGNLRQLMIPEQQRLLETFTLLVASALERLFLTESEEQARLASEREQLRNSLLAALSHDLRTPLTVLFGQAEILTLDLAAEGSNHAPQASEIRQHVLNTTRLVNNLLDMARIQSGGFNLRKEWLTVEEVVGSALKMLEPGLGGRHIELSLSDPLTLIHVDGPLFERVLINLLENAAKYAGPRAQTGVRTSWRDDRLDLEVWDNGPGIPAGQEQAIFAKFARGNKESAIPGVGLGLAICQAIVEVHGGEIYARNRPEGGASFHVLLPNETPPELDIHEVM
ncbi:ATP-binding protein [Cronobacter sakazakii]|uniref:ATP-binding protein n=1 Tax=Cronobacter sakazakii TaxID=28141 RepID=UPI003CFFBAAA